VQAGVLAASLDADRGLVEFLRGVAVGQQRDALLPTAAAKVA
jgi:hypothetical protein